MTATEIERLTVTVAVETAKAIRDLEEYQKKMQQTADKAEAEAKRAAKWVTDNTFFKSTKDRDKWIQGWGDFADKFGVMAAKIGSQLDYHVNRRLQSMASGIRNLFENFGQNPMSLLSGGVAGHAVQSYFQSQIQSQMSLFGDQQRIGASVDSNMDAARSIRQQEADRGTASLRPGQRIPDLQRRRDEAARNATAYSQDVRRYTEALQRVEEGKDRILPKDNPDGTRGTNFATYQSDRAVAEKQQQDAIKNLSEARKERAKYEKEIADLGGDTEHRITRMREENNLLDDRAKLLGKATYETNLLKLENEGFTQEQIQSIRVKEQQLHLDETLLKLRRERMQVGMTSDQRAAFQFDPTGTNPAGATEVQMEALLGSARRTQEEFSSPFEKYQKRLADLKNQQLTGVLVGDNYNRALEDARKKYNAAASAAYGFANAIGHVNALSGNSSAGVAAVQNYRSSLDTSRLQFTNPGAVPQPIFTAPNAGMNGAAADNASAISLLTQMRDSLRMIAKQPAVTLKPAGG